MASSFHSSNIKVMAVAAPHWVARAGCEDVKSLNIGEPFSLQNAIRHAASLAEKRIGVWGKSNWNTIAGRKKSIVMLHYYRDEIDSLKNKLRKIRPQILFIGSMSLSFPGAIEIARAARDILGDKAFIVLGGKHTTETFYEDDGKINHHAGSPLLLMQSGRMGRCFDLVVSGDGEEIVVSIGNIIAKMLENSMPLTEFYNYSGELKEAGGGWIAGWVDEHNSMVTVKSPGKAINRKDLVSEIDLFGIKNKFDIFGAKFTAHAYSHTSRGCIFNCYFCSERRKINGNPKDISKAPFWLYKQFRDVSDYSNQNYSADAGSIFVEDSILLNGHLKALNIFCDLLELNKIKVNFGCQFTIDFILNPMNRPVLKRLQRNGLLYVFFGFETSNETIAASMSKNTNSDEKWIKRNVDVIRVLTGLGIRSGVSVLFGLGESQEERIGLLSFLTNVLKTCGGPQVVSMNIATQHPLQGDDDGLDYDYLEWGTQENSPYLPYFHTLFGEASEKYVLRDKRIPSLEDLKEIKKCYLDFRRASELVGNDNCEALAA